MSRYCYEDSDSDCSESSYKNNRKTSNRCCDCRKCKRECLQDRKKIKDRERDQDREKDRERDQDREKYREKDRERDKKDKKEKKEKGCECSKPVDVVQEKDIRKKEQCIVITIH